MNKETREMQYRPQQPEYEKTAPRDLAKEMHELGESINVKEQMPKNNQETINKMLKECEEGKCKTEEQLTGAGYAPYRPGKFADTSEVHPGHIGYLFANNLLTEGRPLVIGKYQDGYTFYHEV